MEVRYCLAIVRKLRILLHTIKRLSEYRLTTHKCRNQIEPGNLNRHSGKITWILGQYRNMAKHLSIQVFEFQFSSIIITPSWNRWCDQLITPHIPIAFVHDMALWRYFAIHKTTTRTIRINFQHWPFNENCRHFCNLRFYDWNALSSTAIIIPMVDFHLNEMNRAITIRHIRYTCGSNVTIEKWSHCSG